VLILSLFLEVRYHPGPITSPFVKVNSQGQFVSWPLLTGPNLSIRLPIAKLLIVLIAFLPIRCLDRLLDLTLELALLFLQVQLTHPATNPLSTPLLLRAHL
jgi:hypothetical protein